MLRALGYLSLGVVVVLLTYFGFTYLERDPLLYRLGVVALGACTVGPFLYLSVRRLLEKRHKS